MTSHQPPSHHNQYRNSNSNHNGGGYQQTTAANATTIFSSNATGTPTAVNASTTANTVPASNTAAAAQLGQRYELTEFENCLWILAAKCKPFFDALGDFRFALLAPFAQRTPRNISRPRVWSELTLPLVVFADCERRYYELSFLVDPRLRRQSLHRHADGAGASTTGSAVSGGVNRTSASRDGGDRHGNSSGSGHHAMTSLKDTYAQLPGRFKKMITAMHQLAGRIPSLAPPLISAAALLQQVYLLVMCRLRMIALYRSLADFAAAREHPSFNGGDDGSEVSGARPSSLSSSSSSSMPSHKSKAALSPRSRARYAPTTTYVSNASNRHSSSSPTSTTSPVDHANANGNSNDRNGSDGRRRDMRYDDGVPELTSLSYADLTAVTDTLAVKYDRFFVHPALSRIKQTTLSEVLLLRDLFRVHAFLGGYRFKDTMLSLAVVRQKLAAYTALYAPAPLPPASSSSSTSTTVPPSKPLVTMMPRFVTFAQRMADALLAKAALYFYHIIRAQSRYLHRSVSAAATTATADDEAVMAVQRMMVANNGIDVDGTDRSGRAVSSVMIDSILNVPRHHHHRHDGGSRVSVVDPDAALCRQYDRLPTVNFVALIAVWLRRAHIPHFCLLYDASSLSYHQQPRTSDDDNDAVATAAAAAAVAAASSGGVGAPRQPPQQPQRTFIDHPLRGYRMEDHTHAHTRTGGSSDGGSGSGSGNGSGGDSRGDGDENPGNRDDDVNDDDDDSDDNQVGGVTLEGMRAWPVIFQLTNPAASVATSSSASSQSRQHNKPPQTVKTNQPSTVTATDDNSVSGLAAQSSSASSSLMSPGSEHRDHARLAVKSTAAADAFAVDAAGKTDKNDATFVTTSIATMTDTAVDDGCTRDDDHRHHLHSDECAVRSGNVAIDVSSSSLSSSSSCDETKPTTSSTSSTVDGCTRDDDHRHHLHRDERVIGGDTNCEQKQQKQQQQQQRRYALSASTWAVVVSTILDPSVGDLLAANIGSGKPFIYSQSGLAFLITMVEPRVYQLAFLPPQHPLLHNKPSLRAIRRDPICVAFHDIATAIAQKPLYHDLLRPTTSTSSSPSS